MLIDFKEKGREREKQISCLRMCPVQGSNLQTFSVQDDAPTN